MITIAGVPYAMQAPFAESYERVGEMGRTFDGGLFSQVRIEKRRWTGTTSFLSSAELATLRTNTALDAIVSVVDTLRSVTISAMVRIEPALTVTTLWTVGIDAREV
jgi:hypothetical protein